MERCYYAIVETYTCNFYLKWMFWHKMCNISTTTTVTFRFLGKVAYYFLPNCLPHTHIHTIKLTSITIVQELLLINILYRCVTKVLVISSNQINMKIVTDTKWKQWQTIAVLNTCNTFYLYGSENSNKTLCLSWTSLFLPKKKKNLIYSPPQKWTKWPNDDGKRKLWTFSQNDKWWNINMGDSNRKLFQCINYFNNKSENPNELHTDYK